ARGETVPGGLYRFADTAAEKPALEVNGKAVAVVLDKGFARIRREWKKGDVIVLRLPMPVRRVVADEAVKDDAGKVALERGPLVYCAEWPDNGGRALNLALPDGRPLAAEFRSDLFNGVVVITGEALATAKGPAGETPAKKQPFLAIPYYAWAHRGPGEMAVWLPRK
ncbi:MAG: glycoside hydrolase family 127 protein, partial [Candidatus Aminicenantales bacterium]